MLAIIALRFGGFSHSSLGATHASNRIRGIGSNRFSLEWPPKSGRIQQFPEADRAAWFTPAEAERKITRGQLAIVRALLAKLGATE